MVTISTSNLLRHLRNVHKLTGNFRCVCCTSILLYGNRVTLDNHVSNSQVCQITSLKGLILAMQQSYLASKPPPFGFLNLSFGVKINSGGTVQYLVSNNNQVLQFISNKLPINRVWPREVWSSAKKVPINSLARGSREFGLTIHVRLLKPLEGEKVIAYFR